MLSNFSFWIWGLVITQFLSAFCHSLSFIAKPKPKNETEKQLLDLVSNYKPDMGGGIRRSYSQLFIGLSTCFTMVYTMGAVINWYFIKRGISPGVWEGLLLIELAAYTILFLLMIRFTFWPPIIVTGFVFIFVLGAWLTVS
jgi:hypothetical protein